MIYVIAYIAFIISLIAASPILARFLIYSFYKPKLDIFFTTSDEKTVIKTSEIFGEKGETSLNIRNKDKKRDMYIELHYITSKPVEIRMEVLKYVTGQELVGKLKRGFRTITKSDFLPGASVLGPLYLFKPYAEEYTLEVVAYTKMKMSEFGFPIFFGEVDLKPVSEFFTIDPS